MGFGRLPRRLLVCMLLAKPVVCFSQGVPISGHLQLVRDGGTQSGDSSGGVVWLTPVGETKNTIARPHPQRQQLVQRHKSFSPHLIIVQVGSPVEFPNRDPFFHNVFSLFEGKRFDLGLYEAGSTRSVVFDRVGICYIFCNIHSEMSAVIVVLNTPYYAISDHDGQFNIPHVLPGSYEMKVWHERSAPETLNALTRKVSVTEQAVSVGTLKLAEQPSITQAHKNKYGQDYENPTPESPLYIRP